MDRTRTQDGWRRACRGAGLLLLAAAVLLTACAGKEEDDGGGDPLSCTLNTGFVGRSIATGTIILQLSSATCGNLDLDVVFSGISNVFTVGFDITYPAAILTFDGFTSGPLLKQGSPATPPFFSVTESSPGRLVIFASRFSPAGAVDSAGASTLMTLSFSADAIGQGPVVFDLSSSPVEDQVLDESGTAVAATFSNGLNTASVF